MGCDWGLSFVRCRPQLLRVRAVVVFRAGSAKISKEQMMDSWDYMGVLG